MTQEEGAGHDTTERLVLAATRIALDHEPAGPAVVVVVAWVVVVFVVGALDDPGVLLHPAARNNSAMTASAAHGLGLCLWLWLWLAVLRTTAGPGGRSPRGRGGATTYRAR